MRALRIRTFGLILLQVAFASIGELLLGIGMKQIGAVTVWTPLALGRTFIQTVTSGTIWLGIFALLLFFACYLLVLSWADLSYIKPVSAIGYAVIAFLGYAVLHEHVTPVRWLGVSLICVGVALAGQTEVRTTEAGVRATQEVLPTAQGAEL
jgi:drug/metabolite transporter (DMT)-like permease